MRACVLPGGAARGAFQVGVLKALTEKGRKWDLFCGVSVGAINAAHMAQHEFPRAGALTLEAFWRQIKGNESIYKNWFFGILEAMGRRSVYDTTPLANLIRPALGNKFPKKLSVGAVNLTSGQYQYFTQEHPELFNAIMASAAFPVAFPPVKIGMDWYVDGGVRNVSPLKDAVDQGATEIDLIMTTPIKGDLGFWHKKEFNLLDLGSRVLELMATEIAVGDLKEVDLSKVNIYAPERPWLDNPLDFDSTKIRDRIEAGYACGLRL